MISPEIESLLDDVERAAGAKLLWRGEVGLLWEEATARGMRQVFDDILFLAKFLINAMKIVRRMGADNADTIKLTAEVGEKMEKVTTLLRTLVKEAPETWRSPFVENFLSFSPDSMSRLLELLRDLGRVKNFFLDRQSS